MLKKLQKSYKKVFFLKLKKSFKKVKKFKKKFLKVLKKVIKVLKKLKKKFFKKFEKIKLKINYAIRIFPIRILPNPHYAESAIYGFTESRSACLICQISVFRTYTVPFGICAYYRSRS